METKPEKIAPNSPEAEEAVIGSILIDGSIVRNLVDMIAPSDFFLARCRWMYEAAVSVHERGEDVDYLSLGEELRRCGKLTEIGGMAELTQMMNRIPSHLNALTYARIIAVCATRRRLLAAAQKIGELAIGENAVLEQLVQEAEAELFSVTRQVAEPSMVTAAQAIADYYDAVEARNADPSARIGINIGVAEMDDYLGGLGKQRLIILAGRPGEGKTSLALHMARLQAISGRKVAFFSYEMSNEEVINRLASSVCGINDRKLANGQLGDKEWEQFTEACNVVSKWHNLFLSENASLTVRKLRAEARKIQAEHGLDLVIVDYLQLIPSGQKVKDENRNLEVGRLTRELKLLASELKIPVLALSQLSRAVENRADKDITLSDLRDSGEIEAHANQVLFISPVQEDGSMVNIKVGKNRHGPKGKFQLRFHRETNRFASPNNNGKV